MCELRRIPTGIGLVSSRHDGVLVSFPGIKTNGSLKGSLPECRGGVGDESWKTIFFFFFFSSGLNEEKSRNVKIHGWGQAVTVS